MITEKFANELDALKVDNIAQAEMIKDMYVELRILHDENAKLRKALEECRQTHLDCEDGFYSCPKVEGYWGTDHGCTCGADYTNSIIDTALAEKENEE